MRSMDSSSSFSATVKVIFSIHLRFENKLSSELQFIKDPRLCAQHLLWSKLSPIFKLEQVEKCSVVWPKTIFWNEKVILDLYQCHCPDFAQCYKMVFFGSFQNPKSFPVYIWSLTFMKSDSYWKRMLSNETFNDFHQYISEKRAFKIWAKIWNIFNIFCFLSFLKNLFFRFTNLYVQNKIKVKFSD